MPSHDSPAIRARNQGLIAPPPEWGASPEAFTAQAAPVFAGHPGVGARFIGDDQPMGLFLHKLLPPAPIISGHIVPVALRAFRAHRRLLGDSSAIRPFDMCILLYEPPWVYRRVKFSKAEPCGQEEIPRNTRRSSARAGSVFFANSGLGMTVTTRPTRRLRRSLAAHPTRYAPGAFKRPETPVSATARRFDQ